MRIFLAIYVFAIVATVSILGFRGSHSTKPPLEVFPDMDRQARYKPQAANEFFSCKNFLVAALEDLKIMRGG